MRPASAVAGIAMVAAACVRQVPPPAASATTRVDTLVVTRPMQVSPPLPEGTAAEVCLSTGFAARIHIGSSGDTLVSSRRIPLRELQPGLVFEGRYAADRPWFQKAQAFRFERRDYRQTAQPVTMNCEDMKQVGENDGVPLFADLMVISPFERLFIPVSPGRFQPYQTTLPRR